jgi:hypothetical protein
MSDPGQPENVSPQFSVHIRHNKIPSSPNVQRAAGWALGCRCGIARTQEEKKDKNLLEEKRVFFGKRREAMEMNFNLAPQAETLDNREAGSVSYLCQESAVFIWGKNKQN